jgi:CheY-like chemotaxis protein
MDGNGRILLVDDDPEARELLGEYLVDEGYSVETAPDGATALVKLARAGADVIVTDFEMPGMNGIELIRLIAARYPGQAMLLVTAWDQCPIIDAYTSSGGPLLCLRKPIDPDELAVAVRRLMGSVALSDGRDGASAH